MQDLTEPRELAEFLNPYFAALAAPVVHHWADGAGYQAVLIDQDYETDDAIRRAIALGEAFGVEVVHVVWIAHDGSWSGAHDNYYYDRANGFFYVIGRDGDGSAADLDSFEDLARVTHHPRRFAKALRQEYVEAFGLDEEDHEEDELMLVTSPHTDGVTDAIWEGDLTALASTRGGLTVRSFGTTTLYRHADGRYFELSESQWTGSSDYTLEELDESDVLARAESCPDCADLQEVAAQIRAQ